MARAPMQSRRVAYALATRKVPGSVLLEVLMQKRPADVSLMPGMLELPQLHPPGDAEEVLGMTQAELTLREEPVLRVRHSIVGTNYYVEIMALSSRREVRKRALRGDELQWIAARELQNEPLTGLSRKVLQRLRLMRAPGEGKTPDVPLLIGRASRAATGEDK